MRGCVPCVRQYFDDKSENGLLSHELQHPSEARRIGVNQGLKQLETRNPQNGNYVRGLVKKREKFDFTHF